MLKSPEINELNENEIENANLAAEVFDQLYTSRLFQQGYYSRFVRLAQSYIPVKSSAIIDWGCGTGYLLSLFAEDGFSNLHGMDISSKMLEQAKQRQQDFRLTLGDGKALNYSDESFDLFLALSSLHHTPENLLKNVLLEIKRCLKPGACLVIGEPNEHVCFERFFPWLTPPVWLSLRFFRLIGIEFYEDLSHLEPGYTPHHRALTRHELVEALTECGFSVVFVQEPFLVSYAWNAVNNEFLMNLAFGIDKFLGRFVRGGRMIYIVAQKNNL
jgi:ubiquinone/menaquinone biosynthesis C-methylase UbiE